jgi:hypothetical protein
MSKLNISVIISNKVSQRSFWKLHSPSIDFHSWLSSQSCYTLCFYGDSKENPGEAGARGVLYGPRGTQEVDFYWNLGITSNNKAEAYAVFQGVQLAKQRKIII